MKDSTQRFTNRVANYIQYRPGYPAEVIQTLENEVGLSSQKLIADIGSGTGILTRQLLDNGCQVYAIEPNAAMRNAAEEQLGNNTGFISINGTAENTTLPDHSVDGITAGQAFHWFDRLASKTEFRRILRDDGFVALVWNKWLPELSPFLHDYTQLLTVWGTDYTRMSRTALDDADIRQFFYPRLFQQFSFLNFQIFDYEGLKGRLLSSSYAPQEDHPNYIPMMDKLQEIFDSHQTGGLLRFDYQTVLYLCH